MSAVGAPHAARITAVASKKAACCRGKGSVPAPEEVDGTIPQKSLQKIKSKNHFGRLDSR